ncbi:MAG: metal-dependent hydrolase, partial [Gemmatimonadota bacterium]|nr:metal-dependent hydrolase [Gemmatimonadota bacterium]
MDNICHTLAGAALAESGLKRRTALGTATLIIGANFPDIDAIAIPLGHSLAWRRGVTHGVLALVVLPLALTALVLAWDRLVRRRARSGAKEAVRPRQILFLAMLAVLTHPVLDWMNTYGMRWLMPFDGRWFYGDALFIIDPWLWIALGAGVVAARARQRRGTTRPYRPARWALAFAGAYIALMVVSSGVGERVVRGRLTTAGVAPGAEIIMT